MFQTQKMSPVGNYFSTDLPEKLMFLIHTLSLTKLNVIYLKVAYIPYFNKVCVFFLGAIIFFLLYFINFFI